MGRRKKLSKFNEDFIKKYDKNKSRCRVSENVI